MSGALYSPAIVVNNVLGSSFKERSIFAPNFFSFMKVLAFAKLTETNAVSAPEKKPESTKQIKSKINSISIAIDAPSYY